MTGQSAKPADTALARSCVCVCTCARAGVRVNAFMYVGIFPCVYVRTNLNTHKHIYIYRSTHIHGYTVPLCEGGNRRLWVMVCECARVSACIYTRVCKGEYLNGA